MITLSDIWHTPAVKIYRTNKQDFNETIVNINVNFNLCYLIIIMVDVMFVN